jgi:hypothetical protein
MTWVTWVTWAFVALAAAVTMVAMAISRGRLQVSFEPPYEPSEQQPPVVSATGRAPSGTRSGIEWSEPAAGRPDLDGLEPDEGAAPTAQNHPPTTGEPADGRHEAQDR